MRGERALERIVLLQDLALVGASMFAAVWLRERLVGVVPGLRPTVPASESLLLLLVFLPTWALGAERHGLHHVTTLTGPPLERLRRLLMTQAWGAVALALILMAAQAPLNRSLIVAFLGVSTIVLALAKVPQGRWIERTHGRAVALLLGMKRGGRPGEIELVRGRRVEVLEEWTPAALRLRLQEGGVDELVVGPVVPRDRVPALLAVSDDVGVPALVAVERLDNGLSPPQAELIGRSVYLSYERSQPDRPALLVKAMMDRAGAAILLALSSPLLLLAAAAIKLTSRGSIFFVQERGGLNGHPFRMIKFRTMRPGAEAERTALMADNEMDGPVFKIARDPRVTPVGALLRRTSVDELPQLLNVLVGQMSLVGPRPLPVIETRELTGSHRRRLSMKPGMTCLWQVGGRNEVGFQEWMSLDLEYVDHWSLGLDLAILLRTIPALLSARGAR
jgi:exopolysaccharide biosynthesis polyprenyl glycosylphosphotransferase